MLMSVYCRHRLLIISALLFIPTLTLFSFPFLPRIQQTKPDQQSVVIKNDEFSIRMPVQPDVRVKPRVPYRFDGGVQVEYQIETGAYQNGVVFLVEAYDNLNPARFLQDYRRWGTASRRWTNAALSELTLNGYRVLQYVVKTDTSYLVCRLFNSKRRSYVITVAARDEYNPSIKSFLASLTMAGRPLRDDSSDASTATVDPVNHAAVVPQPAVTTQVFEIKDVNRKALVIWKPEAAYTEEARSHGINGVVILKAVFSATGEVSDLVVVKRSESGLTERAIEAARKIKFLPAEKDGKLVSQRITMEYHFNSY